MATLREGERDSDLADMRLEELEAEFERVYWLRNQAMQRDDDDLYRKADARIDALINERATRMIERKHRDEQAREEA